MSWRRSEWYEGWIRPHWTVVAAILVVVLGISGLLMLNQLAAPAGVPAGGHRSPGALDPIGPAPSGTTSSPSASPSPSRSPSASPSASPSPATRPVDQGTVLWRADPSLGQRNFEGIETEPGTVTVADDPQGRYGTSVRFETWPALLGGKVRCESRGLRSSDGSVLTLGADKEGQTFYLGWRSLWNPMPTQSGAWVALFQMHVSGVPDGGLNVGPFVLRTLGDGALHFQLISPDGSDRHIWSGPLPVGSWSSFVIGFKLSRSNTDGWVEFWYNGVPQRFTNGATRYPGATLWGTHDNVKWGIYRSGANLTGGNAVAYLNHAQLGTGYGAVAP